MVYQGYEVMDFWPHWESPPSESVARSSTILENTTGLPVVKAMSDTGRALMSMTLRITSRSEIARFRAFLDTIRGRTIPFWCPTWQADFRLTADLSGTSMTVESVGYAARMFPKMARRHLALVRHDRTVYPRGVTAAVDNGTTETLTLNLAPGATIRRDVSLVSLMLLCRMDTDAVQMNYLTPTLMDAQIRVIEIPREAPTP